MPDWWMRQTWQMACVLAVGAALVWAFMFFVWPFPYPARPK